LGLNRFGPRPLLFRLCEADRDAHQRLAGSSDLTGSITLEGYNVRAGSAGRDGSGMRLERVRQAASPAYARRSV
jgi:hypothetical protein